MIHGKCKSAGCYAMTDALIEEIYAMARESFLGGHDSFQVHAFPFRMTDENMARYASHEAYPFWQTLKEGYDYFELTRQAADGGRVQPPLCGERGPARRRSARAQSRGRLPGVLQAEARSVQAAARRADGRAAHRRARARRCAPWPASTDETARRRGPGSRRPARMSAQPPSMGFAAEHEPRARPVSAAARHASLAGVPSAVWRRLVARALPCSLPPRPPSLLGRDVLFDWDRIEIEAERARRLAQAALGMPLPGTPDLAELAGRLAAHGLSLGAPVFIRIFKREFELELWLKRERPLPAVRRLSRSAAGRAGSAPSWWRATPRRPEGFYTVDAKALNPASRWHRSFNLGFPNAFDRAHHRTGSFVMVHGGCASIGCYAMTDPVVDEIWRLVTAALKGGPAALPRARLPVPHDRGEPGQREP